MAKRRKPRTSKFVGFIYMGIAVVLIYTLITNAFRVYEQRQEYVKLVEEKEVLEKEKEELQEEVNLLEHDDYVVRYARDHYVFSKSGEKVINLPDEE